MTIGRNKRAIENSRKCWKSSPERKKRIIEDYETTKKI